MFLVTEEQIIAAMKLVWERMKIVIEPSAAVTIAVALFNEDFKKIPNTSRVALLMSGGNVDLDHLPWVK